MSGSNFAIPVAKTSLWIAGERYRESQRSDKVIDDPYAEILLGQTGMKMLEDMRKLFSQSILRTRAMALRAKWVEDLMQKAVANGITQIVNPACGLDTYAWRINLPSHVTYYELDFPEIMEYKAKQLADANVICNYKPISIDLRDQSWPNKLIENGFDKTKKTLWITMGFLLYVPEDGVHSFLDRVNELSAPGSWYTTDVCKYVKEDPKGSDLFEKILRDNGSPVEFLTDDPKGLFEKHGFSKLKSYLTYYEYSKELGVEYSEDDSRLMEQQKSGASLVLVEK